MANQVDGTGLNKTERLKRKRAEQEEEERKKSLPLDPPFPGGVARFDPLYFRVVSSLEPKEN